MPYCHHHSSGWGAPARIRCSARRRHAGPRPKAALGATSLPSGLRQGDAALALVLAAPVLVGDLARLVALEEQQLGHALVGVDLRRQVGGIGELEGDVALPLGFERRDVDDDSAAGVGGLADAQGQHVAGNPEIFDGARQGEGVRRNNATVALDVDEAPLIECLGVDGRREDVGEDLERRRTADVVAVARGAEGNHAFVVDRAYLPGLERLDHTGAGLVPDPAVGLDGHLSSMVMDGGVEAIADCCQSAPATRRAQST